MPFVVGSHADVLLPNVLIEKVLPDESWILIMLPDAGDDNPIEIWVPTNDPRVTISPIVPDNWPPQEGDVWIVPGVTPPAFVVNDGKGGMYFLSADFIRNLYLDSGKPLPPTTDAALTAYGSALVLLYREPAS